MLCTYLVFCLLVSVRTCSCRKLTQALSVKQRTKFPLLRSVKSLHVLNVWSLYRWEGKDENEMGRCKETGKIHVTVNHKYYRPTEVVSENVLSVLLMNAPITQSPNCSIWTAGYKRFVIASLLLTFSLSQ